MVTSVPLFESAISHLKAGAAVADCREEESTLGDLTSTILGGGIAVRLADGKKKSVPAKVEAKELEMLRFMAIVGLSGEHVDAVWWAREDQLVVASSHESYAGITQLKRAWARVKKDALSEPLFAPRFPTSSGAKADWDALLACVVDLHNSGKVPGLISHGKRDRWPDAPNVYPSSASIRDANLASLKEDGEIKMILSDIELEAGLPEAEAESVEGAETAPAQPTLTDVMELEVVEDGDVEDGDVEDGRMDDREEVEAVGSLEDAAAAAAQAQAEDVAQVASFLAGMPRMGNFEADGSDGSRVAAPMHAGQTMASEADGSDGHVETATSMPVLRRARAPAPARTRTARTRTTAAQLPHAAAPAAVCVLSLLEPTPARILPSCSCICIEASSLLTVACVFFGPGVE